LLQQRGYCSADTPLRATVRLYAVLQSYS